MRSTDAIPEPFVTFLVEVNWARGRLMREYTVLLDPPVYTPGENASTTAPVTAPSTTPLAATAAAPPTPRKSPAPRPQPAPPESAAPKAAAPAPKRGARSVLRRAATGIHGRAV